jgi:hypothetical protein
MSITVVTAYHGNDGNKTTTNLYRSSRMVIAMFVQFLRNSNFLDKFQQNRLV